MKKYFFHDGKEKSQGYSLEEVSKLQLNPKDLVWFKGLPDWQPVGNFEELRPFIKYPEPKTKNESSENTSNTFKTHNSEKIKSAHPKKQLTGKKKILGEIIALFILLLIALGIFGVYWFFDKGYLYAKDFIYPTITFHTEELQKMADSGTAYVVNKCGKNDFNYGSQTINLSNGDRKTVLIYRKKTEGISMFSDAQNRFEYAFELSGAYKKLLQEIKEKQTAILPANESDKSYPGCEQYLINNCMFIDCGRPKDSKYFFFVIIRKDRLSPLSNTIGSINNNDSSIKKTANTDTVTNDNLPLEIIHDESQVLAIERNMYTPQAIAIENEGYEDLNKGDTLLINNKGNKLVVIATQDLVVLSKSGDTAYYKAGELKRIGKLFIKDQRSKIVVMSSKGQTYLGEITLAPGND